MGNILSLHRNGLHNNNTFDEIDNLTYTYEGNQLVKVDDSAQEPIYKDCFDFKDGADEDIEYEYDANGNMTKDLNHGICNIEYNCINLPSRVEFIDGSKVLYTYDAKGTKLRTDYYINPMSAVVPQAANGQGASSANLRHTWTDYCGNFIYENDTLKQTLIEGGYISYEYPQNTAVTSISQLAPTYHFYVQDHLGNNRLVVDEGGTIEQINHYYPYGGLMGESKNLSSNQRYKYNGKEFDRMHGLDWYDYGARYHDPATVRWFSVDQLAEKYKGISPYVYCANDPVNKFDPDGRKIKGLSVDIKGNVVITSNATKDVQRVAKSMLATQTGTKMLKQMINSNIRVKIYLSPNSVRNKVSKGINTTYAITVQGNYNKKDNYGQYFKNGMYKIKEATITLYLGSIEWSTNDKGNKNYGLSVDEAIGVEAGHEAVHATDESEIDKDKKYENNHNGLPRSDKEKKADSVEDKIRQETFENKNKQ